MGAEEELDDSADFETVEVESSAKYYRNCKSLASRILFARKSRYHETKLMKCSERRWIVSEAHSFETSVDCARFLDCLLFAVATRFLQSKLRIAYLPLCLACSIIYSIGLLSRNNTLLFSVVHQT